LAPAKNLNPEHNNAPRLHSTVSADRGSINKITIRATLHPSRVPDNLTAIREPFLPNPPPRKESPPATLNGILTGVAAHLKIAKEALAKELFS
jgi:hypothetical protein